MATVTRSSSTAKTTTGLEQRTRIGRVLDDPLRRRCQIPDLGLARYAPIHPNHGLLGTRFVARKSQGEQGEGMGNAIQEVGAVRLLDDRIVGGGIHALG